MATLGPQDQVRAATNAVRSAADEANRLVQTTMDDVERSSERAVPGSLLLSAGAVLGVIGLSNVFVGLALGFSKRRTRGPLAMGALLLGCGVACVAASRATFPRRPFARSRNELREDLSASADALR
jgi:hypothetical protein